jgi:hypothetical protein
MNLSKQQLFFKQYHIISSKNRKEETSEIVEYFQLMLGGLVVRILQEKVGPQI